MAGSPTAPASPGTPTPAPGRWRARLTDPLVPVLLLAGAASVAVATMPPLTWAVTGGLAGWSLSGSV